MVYKYVLTNNTVWFSCKKWSIVVESSSLSNSFCIYTQHKSLIWDGSITYDNLRSQCTWKLRARKAKASLADHYESYQWWFTCTFYKLVYVFLLLRAIFPKCLSPYWNFYCPSADINLLSWIKSTCMSDVFVPTSRNELVVFNPWGLWLKTAVTYLLIKTNISTYFCWIKFTI